jgi:hypothetical protein
MTEPTAGSDYDITKSLHHSTHAVGPNDFLQPSNQSTSVEDIQETPRSRKIGNYIGGYRLK